MILLGLTFVSFFLTGKNVSAQDVDLTHLIVNSDFDYKAEGVLITETSWKPLALGLDKFYGWECDLFNKTDLGSDSQGINKDFTNKHGEYGAWISGNCILPEFFEFYQIIDKDDLEAGTYKVQCLLAAKTNKRTSQRLFANQNVQYFSAESWYTNNQTAGEIATFAGWVPTAGASDDTDGFLQEMVVYTTIGENDSLKIGIRTGSVQGAGTVSPKANPMWGWIKTDYFRLTRIDPAKAANASLSDITLSEGSLAFSSETMAYDVELPEGTATVTPSATASVEDVIISGTETVDVSSGAGTSTIVVTALDGTTTKTYTINYTVGSSSGLNDVNTKVAYSVENGKLSVTGVETYIVYDINGIKIADVKEGMASVDLMSGIYIVKTKNAGTFKVVVR